MEGTVDNFDQSFYTPIQGFRLPALKGTWISSLSWAKMWRQRMIKKSHWLFRRLGPRKDRKSKSPDLYITRWYKNNLSTSCISTPATTEPPQPPPTPTECICTTLEPIGVEDGRIPNSQMNATSTRITEPGSTYTGPEQARLNNQPSASGSGAWEPKDEEGVLTIYFNKVENLREIRTQGSPSSNKYTRQFFVFISRDGENFDEMPLKTVRNLMIDF